MSPPSKRIEDWINAKNFQNADEVRDYVRQHGGASLAMDATIDFVFGTGIQEEELPFPQSTGKTPLEQLQEGEVPQEETYQPIPQMEEPLPQQVKESIQEPVKGKSLFRRFMDFLGGK